MVQARRKCCTDSRNRFVVNCVFYDIQGRSEWQQQYLTLPGQEQIKGVIILNKLIATKHNKVNNYFEQFEKYLEKRLMLGIDTADNTKNIGELGYKLQSLAKELHTDNKMIILSNKVQLHCRDLLQFERLKKTGTNAMQLYTLKVMLKKDRDEIIDILKQLMEQK